MKLLNSLGIAVMSANAFLLICMAINYHHYRPNTWQAIMLAFVFVGSALIAKIGGEE
jgi:ABC-type Fe3+ transport system permease subunit